MDIENQIMSYSFSVGALDIGVFVTGLTGVYGSSLGSCPAWLESTAGEIKQQFAGLGWQKVGPDVCGSFLLSPQPSAPRCFRDRSTGMKKRAKEAVATRVCGVRCWRWGRPVKGHGVTWGFPMDLAVYQELCALNGAPWFRLSTTPRNLLKAWQAGDHVLTQLTKPEHPRFPSQTATLASEAGEQAWMEPAGLPGN